MTGILPASFTRAKGRHRAPGKLSTTMNSTARVSAAVAVSGGIVAAVAVPQVADAAPASHAVAASGLQAAGSFDGSASAAELANYAAENGTVLDLSKLLSAGAQAKPLLEGTTARSYTQPAASASTPTTTASATASTSRSATRSTVAAAPASSSGSSSSGSTSSGGSGSTGVSLPSSANSSEIIAIAKRYLGIPYVAGGTTPATGFDCSGFTSFVYRQAGISIPRVSRDQYAASTHVSNPQPGDLVFFGDPVHHVGIYAGNNMMIAAPYPGQVVRLQPIWDTPIGYGRF